MNIHKNARLTPRSRAELVRRVIDEGQAARPEEQPFEIEPAPRIAAIYDL